MPAKKKPEPSIDQPWSKAKAELYFDIARLTRGILGGQPPTAPPGGGAPPFGFGDGDFRGSFFVIDPRRVKLIPDERAIMFPVALVGSPETAALWVKSVQIDSKDIQDPAVPQSGLELERQEDSERLAAMLLAMRDSVKVENTDRQSKDTVLVKIDLKGVALIGTDEKAVAQGVAASR